MNLLDGLYKLTDSLKQIDAVEGVLLGGSYGAGKEDSGSDFDLYIYSDKEISLDERKPLLAPHLKYAEFDNRYWETEDDGILAEGNMPIDIIYRNLNSFDGMLQSVVLDGNGWIGYTTCFWYNLLNSRILFDRHGRLDLLQKKYRLPYPEKLRESIIRKNRELLKGKMPSYYDQIEKALRRNDRVSVQHRITAFLASYFDILFAVNRVLHPGEKKLIEKSRDLCRVLPDEFENDMNQLLYGSGSNEKELMPLVDRMISRLDKILV